MDTADDVDFELQGFEDGTAERSEPGMHEDVFGKRTDALTFSAKVVFTSGSERDAMHASRLPVSGGSGGVLIQLVQGVVSTHLRVVSVGDVDAKTANQRILRAYQQVFSVMGFATVLFECKVVDTFWLDKPAGDSNMPSFPKQIFLEWAFGSLATWCGYPCGRELATVLGAFRLFVGRGFKRHAACFEIHSSVLALIARGAWSAILRPVRLSRGQNGARSPPTHGHLHSCEATSVFPPGIREQRAAAVLRPLDAVLGASATREAVVEAGGGSLAVTVTKRKQPDVRGG